MNLLEKKLKTIASEKRCGLSLFLTAGYPTLNATLDLLFQFSELGVDFFEIGFPFSDPIADGPVIQKSSEVALKNGITWKNLLNLAARFRKSSDVPLVLMSYANPLFSKTWDLSSTDVSNSGFNGVIIPDLSLEESAAPRKSFQKNELSLIQLVAPTSPVKRIEKIVKNSDAFIYCVSVTGVTGARAHLPEESIKGFLAQVNQVSPLPSYLGFGISEPNQIKFFRKSAHGFIIGSALIKFLEKEGSSMKKNKLKDFICPFLEEVRA